MKDIILVISLLLAVGLSVVVVRFAEKADKAGKSLEEERYSRMVAEETLQKNDAKLTTFQERVKEDQDKMAKIEDILDQEKSVNSDLKKQYDAINIKLKLIWKLNYRRCFKKKAAAVAALQAQVKPAPVPATSSTTSRAISCRGALSSKYFNLQWGV